MGHKFKRWQCLSSTKPATIEQLRQLLLANRSFKAVAQLHYGDWGLMEAMQAIAAAIQSNKRIALYADYDVDGTMSCVSWVWFFQQMGYTNYTTYIPCRFKEGYGLNLKAIQYLIDEQKAQLIITMDTGITANAEAAYCRQRGVEFICTDHHQIQPAKMPDCIILNPKFHPDSRYQELCGCGITFVLLRQLAKQLRVASGEDSLWTDLLALAGMATICDIVPLNGVNHKLAKMGVAALMRSQRPVLKKLRQACASIEEIDEKDVGFRLGPRINAVGRLEHADLVVQAFIGEHPDPLIRFMEECNERRRHLQEGIIAQAQAQAVQYKDCPILFLGGDWHPGVVGIAASKLAEEFWRPVWLFQRQELRCKGSARSIPGFDVTGAMQVAHAHFVAFGGHKAAAGFTFETSQEELIRRALIEHAQQIKETADHLWQSALRFDCLLPLELAHLELAQMLDELKPFGCAFEEPKFCIEADIAHAQYYNDKSSGQPKHTAVSLSGVPYAKGAASKVLFFNAVYPSLLEAKRARFVVTASRSTFKGQTSLSLFGSDFAVLS